MDISSHIFETKPFHAFLKYKNYFFPLKKEVCTKIIHQSLINIHKSYINHSSIIHQSSIKHSSIIYQSPIHHSSIINQSSIIIMASILHGINTPWYQYSMVSILHSINTPWYQYSMVSILHSINTT